MFLIDCPSEWKSKVFIRGIRAYYSVTYVTFCVCDGSSSRAAHRQFAVIAAKFVVLDHIYVQPIPSFRSSKYVVLGKSVSDDRLQETVRAHMAVCGMLQSKVLSDQSMRHLNNLKTLLELEISALLAERQSELSTK